LSKVSFLSFENIFLNKLIPCSLLMVKDSKVRGVFFGQILEWVLKDSLVSVTRIAQTLSKKAFTL